MPQLDDYYDELLFGMFDLAGIESPNTIDDIPRLTPEEDELISDSFVFSSSASSSSASSSSASSSSASSSSASSSSASSSSRKPKRRTIGTARDTVAYNQAIENKKHHEAANFLTRKLEKLNRVKHYRTESINKHIKISGQQAYELAKLIKEPNYIYLINLTMKLYLNCKQIEEEEALVAHSTFLIHETIRITFLLLNEHRLNENFKPYLLFSRLVLHIFTTDILRRTSPSRPLVREVGKEILLVGINFLDSYTEGLMVHPGPLQKISEKTYQDSRDRYSLHSYISRISADDMSQVMQLTHERKESSLPIEITQRFEKVIGLIWAKAGLSSKDWYFLLRLTKLALDSYLQLEQFDKLYKYSKIAHTILERSKEYALESNKILYYIDRMKHFYIHKITAISKTKSAHDLYPHYTKALNAITDCFNLYLQPYPDKTLIPASFLAMIHRFVNMILSMLDHRKDFEENFQFISLKIDFLNNYFISDSEILYDNLKSLTKFLKKFLMTHEARAFLKSIDKLIPTEPVDCSIALEAKSYLQLANAIKKFDKRSLTISEEKTHTILLKLVACIINAKIHNMNLKQGSAPSILYRQALFNLIECHAVISQYVFCRQTALVSTLAFSCQVQRLTASSTSPPTSSSSSSSTAYSTDISSEETKRSEQPEGENRDSNPSSSKKQRTLEHDKPAIPEYAENLFVLFGDPDSLVAQLPSPTSDSPTESLTFSSPPRFS